MPTEAAAIQGDAVQKALQAPPASYGGKIDHDFGPQTAAALDRLTTALKADVPPVVNSGTSTAAAAILSYAEHFMGLIEVKPNDKWDDLATKGSDARAEELREALIKIGWEVGYAYCIAGIEVVYRKAYESIGKPDISARVGKLLTLGVVDSFNRVKEAGLSTREPVPGAIGFMRHVGTSNGHAFLVRERNGGVILTYEFNTSPNPGTVEADRNGDGNYRKKRAYTFEPTGGLQLLGFMNPL